MDELKKRRDNKRDIIMERVKRNVLKMTIYIVTAFVICWTPYVIMCLWYQIDFHSAKQIPNHVQAELFMFAVTNSCVNPIVYSLNRKSNQISNFFRTMKSTCFTNEDNPAHV